MQELLNQLNEMSTEELEGLILRAQIILEKKEEDARLEAQRLEQELERQRKAKELEEQISQLHRQLEDLNNQGGSTLCPSCGTPIAAGSAFCSACGTRLTETPAPAVPQSAPQPTPQPAPQPVSQPVQQPVYTPPTPQPTPQPAAQPAPDGDGAVQHYSGDQKKWQLLPGETVLLKWDGAAMLLPDPKTKDVYYLELTNRRLLISSEKASSASMRNVAFGMAGHLLTPEKGKPWLEVPLSAIRGFWKGQAKKEFCFEADTVYSFVINSVDKLISMLYNLIPQAGK